MDPMDESAFVDPPTIDNSVFVSRVKLLSGIFLSFCVCLGLYGNIMSVVIFSHSSMRSSINFLLSSLSLIDAALLIFVIFVLILLNFHVVFPTHGVDQFYPYIILILYPISTMTQTCSIWTFVLISLERMIAICQPLHRHKLMTMTEAKMAQFLVFFCGISYNVVRFWEYKLVPVESEFENETQLVQNYGLISLLRKDANYFLVYSTSMHLCTHFLLPFAIILTAHLNVFRALKKARKQIRSVRRSEERHRGTTLMIMTLTLLFVLFNALPLAGNLWETLDPALHDGPWMKSGLVINELANCLSVLNSACTFIIYLIYCKKYRRLFKRYLYCRSAPDGLPLSQTESISMAHV